MKYDRNVGTAAAAAAYTHNATPSQNRLSSHESYSLVVMVIRSKVKQSYYVEYQDVNYYSILYTTPLFRAAIEMTYFDISAM